METSVKSFSLPRAQPLRAPHRWLLALIMITIITVGWSYPLLGFGVPVAMVVGMAGGFFRGRYVCGNICPRGSFFDTFFRFVSGSRPVPPHLQNIRFRWLVMGFLMTMMVFQISRNPGDPMHWGRVFWFMCAATTALGVVLGLIYRARTWCTFCPVGTMANAVGGGKEQMLISDACRNCKICDKSCPMGLEISDYRETGLIPHRDCIKCESCHAACPSNALSWPQN
ncbi:MAG: 4Fe-4S binding protein [Geobacter sp.]|nr:4Fe-4S binding protein [Geobacter sp.]